MAELSRSRRPFVCAAALVLSAAVQGGSLDLLVMPARAQEPAMPQASIEDLRARASTAFASNDFAQARERYEAILALAPDDKDAYFQLGEISLALRDSNEAQRRFERLLKLSADDEGWQLRGYWGLGDLAVQRGNLADAQKHYGESLGIARRIVERFGESPEALRDISLSLQRTGFTQAVLGDKPAGLADAREGLRLLEDVGTRHGMVPQIVQDIEKTKALIARIEARP
ncbi:MAG TPA: tetratricopeptide repeat protein [Tepidisphaeraceae bacterium]|nr:tetratricopeptide repeat protein [Tepidisphaeraceae bacterium]